MTWQRLLIKGAKDNELDTVQNLASFFRTHPSFLNSKEAQTGMSALHWASRLGHIVSVYSIVLYIFVLYCVVLYYDVYNDTVLIF